MDNRVPRNYDPLIQLAEAAADGAHTHGATIGLAHVTEDVLRSALSALVGTLPGPGGVPPGTPGLKALWDWAKSNKTAKTAALHTAQANGRYLARMCVHTLQPVFGETWNAAWNETGLTGGSLAIPAQPLPLLQQLRAYYGMKPAREVANFQGLACTAAACEAEVQHISDAESASNQSKTDFGNAQKAYLAGLDRLYTTLTGLRNELTQLISDDDARWLAFGFERPADAGTPEQPENVVATPGAAGSKMLIIRFEAGRHCESYRVTALHQTTGQELTHVIVAENETILTLAELAAGTLVAITVTGRNAKGETQPTAPITAAVP